MLSGTTCLSVSDTTKLQCLAAASGYIVNENGDVTTPAKEPADNSMIIGIGVVVVIILLAIYFFKVTPHARTPAVCTVRSAVSVCL